jgi:hypothetical protein
MVEAKPGSAAFIMRGKKMETEQGRDQEAARSAAGLPKPVLSDSTYELIVAQIRVMFALRYAKLNRLEKMAGGMIGSIAGKDLQVVENEIKVLGELLSSPIHLWNGDKWGEFYGKVRNM